MEHQPSNNCGHKDTYSKKCVRTATERPRQIPQDKSRGIYANCTPSATYSDKIYNTQRLKWGKPRAATYEPVLREWDKHYNLITIHKQNEHTPGDLDATTLRCRHNVSRVHQPQSEDEGGTRVLPLLVSGPVRISTVGQAHRQTPRSLCRSRSRKTQSTTKNDKFDETTGDIYVSIDNKSEKETNFNRTKMSNWQLRAVTQMYPISVSRFGIPDSQPHIHRAISGPRHTGHANHFALPHRNSLELATECTRMPDTSIAPHQETIPSHVALFVCMTSPTSSEELDSNSSNLPPHGSCTHADSKHTCLLPSAYLEARAVCKNDSNDSASANGDNTGSASDEAGSTRALVEID